MNLYISRKPDKKGGGSNTFACNFVLWAKKRGHKIVSNLKDSERAVIIANFGEVSELREAKQQGCYIIHRIDEYFEKNEDAYRMEKHKKIHDLNRFADVTVFQSEFTYHNAYPFLKPRRYEIILNGGDPEMFYPGRQVGRYIGHVTWGIGIKQRLDILHKYIMGSPDERFLLIGRHKESEYNFEFPNVELEGLKKREKIPAEYRKMKMLYYPSQNDPCSNTIIEAILSGVPVCYNEPGGAPELVKDCGTTLENAEYMLHNLEEYRSRCLQRNDLHFDKVMEKYMAI